VTGTLGGTGFLEVHPYCTHTSFTRKFLLDRQLLQYYSKLHMFVTFQSSGVITSRKKG